MAASLRVHSLGSAANALMLGMLEVPTPPLYGLTSEEVRERSSRTGSP